MTNPLLALSQLPQFDAIRPEHISPAINHLLHQAQATVAKIQEVSAPTWENVVVPLEEATEALWRVWGYVSHMHSVVNTPKLRQEYNDNLPKISRFNSELGQNITLFKQYNALRSSKQWATLQPAQQKSIDNALRDFRLGGAELDATKRARLCTIQQELSALGAQFAQNILDATDSWAYYVDDANVLTGINQDVVHAAAKAALAEGRAGWKFTLHMPCYLPVLTQADNRQLREILYRGYVVRASDQGDNPTLDNTAVMQHILRLRTELAQLLGYPNYAEYALVARMAESAQQVSSFLNDLCARATPFAQQDRAELDAFALEVLGIDQLEAWDIEYAKEKLKQQRFGFSEQKVKEYFTEPKVLSGLFKTIRTLYNVEILPDTAPIWHKDVHFYRVQDTHGQLIGQFYLDLYARQGKRAGAWMDDCRQRRDTPFGVQTPIAFVVCNFGSGQEGCTATFTHHDVITLYHEMGHCLHQLMTAIDVLSVSGINGVEWDAVELPSQFMENFCWEWTHVELMTAHIQTGETLPYSLFEKICAARHFHSGSATLRQIEFALFDMRLHSETQKTDIDVMHILESVRAAVAVRRPPEWARFPHQFAHIFAGGYAAGYYSYKWAEVLSADAYAAFEEHPEQTQRIGQRFLKEILSRGGSRSAKENFIAFRGRPPSIEALLQHCGMSNKTHPTLSPSKAAP